MKRDIITIVDFGGQYAHLIANRVRRLGVYAEIVQNDVNVNTIKHSKGIIFSGGPQSVDTDLSPKISDKVFKLHIPILGICYGHQVFAFKFGGKIGRIPEYGKCLLRVNDKSTLFKGVNSQETVWQNHGDAVLEAPKGFSVLASTADNEVSAMSNVEKKWYSVQFHPEVTHSGQLGKQIFQNFIFDICKAQKSWSMKNYLEDLKASIKSEVGKRNVFLLVSGGVDSTVCFALLNSILGPERVRGLHIDTGFMRKNESKMVDKMLKDRGFNNLEIFNAEQEFMKRLKDVYDPEEKRKIIGKAYLDIKDEALKKYNLDEKNWLLAQGTIYPDTIESGGTKNADTIKTHHNRIDQIQELIKQGLIIEPLKELYKDEVREVGRILKLPVKLIDRHPFPGPGLAIRALCNQIKRVAISRSIDSYKPYKVEIVDIKSVGIKGDARSYANPAIISGKYNFEKLQSMMTEITNQQTGVNRVVYNVLGCEFANVKLHQQFLNEQYLRILREVDDITTEIIRKEKLLKKIWQCPTVILPLGNDKSKFSIILRPVDSIDAMSAKAYELSESILMSISKRIKQEHKEIYAVFYDLTSKPPGTIEWE